MTNFGLVGLSQQDTTRGPSDIIWRKPEIAKLSDPAFGASFFDDFLAVGTAATNDYISESGFWTSYEDTGSTLGNIAGNHHGILQLLTDTTDNDEISLQKGSPTSVHCVLDDAAGAKYAMAWEARFNVSNITDDTGPHVFLGMAEENSAAADFMVDDTGDMVDKDYIGFHIDTSNAGTLTVKFNKASGTDVTVLSYGTDLVADTWYKVGMVYRPSNPDSKKITFYLDGVDLGSYVTATHLQDDTNFPAGEQLSTIFAVKNSAAAAGNMEIDWVRFAQSHTSI